MKPLSYTPRSLSSLGAAGIMLRRADSHRTGPLRVTFANFGGRP
jgi:hypothetical protein